tara:strand:- start:4014 stop:5456 length:1443 start_codon:yes stop_codon:yes gene_type:complete
MSAVREFPSVTLTNNSNLVQINTNDSNFSVVPGSVIVVAGDRPRVVTSGDTVNRTLTLSIAYIGDDVVEKSAALIPLGQNDALLSAMTSLTEAQNGLAEAYGNGPGTVGEISFSMIVDPPVTATQWPTWVQVQGDINEVLPETAKRFPNFPEIGGKVSVEQLPDDIDTDNKRTQALSPPVRQKPSLTHILSDYPTLKKTVDIPTQSPNNRREMLFDDARQVAYVALTEKWLRIPTTIATRKFMVVKAGRYLRFNSAFTGDVTITVYPMGKGGTGLPSNPSLADYQWHTVTINVTDLWTLGRDSGNYFEGIIDFVELKTASANNWERLDSEKSKFTSLNAFFDNDYSTPRTPFETFELRQDGYWYSQDITPDVPYSIGASWTQDANDPRLYHANNVSDSNDGVRFFGDAYDNYEVEIIVVAEIDRPLALTSSNESDLTVKFSGTERFICDSRLFLKRTNSALPVTGQIRIESIRIRVPNNG